MRVFESYEADIRFWKRCTIYLTCALLVITTFSSWIISSSMTIEKKFGPICEDIDTGINQLLISTVEIKDYHRALEQNGIYRMALMDSLRYRKGEQ